MVVITYQHDQVREEDFVRCSACKMQIGFVEDHLDIVQNGRIGVFNNVFNVSKNYLRQVNVNTVADVYCAGCGTLLGLKLIVVPRPSLNISEGRFLMKLIKLVYWNDYPMIFQTVNDNGDVDIDQFLLELGGGAIIGQVVNVQRGGANVERVPNDQDVDQLADEIDNMDLGLHK